MNLKDRVSLHNQFKDEKSMGIKYYCHEFTGSLEHDPDKNDLLENPFELNAYLPGDFGQMGNCTNCARYVVSELNRGDVYGFLVENNHVESKEVQYCFGHDFSVLM